MATLYVDTGYWFDDYAQTGITVDWEAREIFVPISELTLVQTSPTVIYQLDLNVFRLALKDLEDAADGIVFPDTHNHNPPVTVGGVTLARVVEIINGYTITFEDGQYAVNLIGANSNVGDRVNVNQVSVRSANSAGLIDPRVDALLDVPDSIETNLTMREALRLVTAALAGKLSGAPAGPVVIRNVGDTKDRITATIDPSGNRTDVIVDGS